MTYQEYLNLGKKRAPNFLYERKDIYTIAEYYQDKLEEYRSFALPEGALALMSGWSGIDLSRFALDERAEDVPSQAIQGRTGG